MMTKKHKWLNIQLFLVLDITIYIISLLQFLFIFKENMTHYQYHLCSLGKLQAYETRSLTQAKISDS